MNKWIINNTPNKLRLDIFLTKQLNQPRHQVQKIIKAGQITINERPVTRPHYWLKNNDVVSLLVDTKLKKPALILKPKIIKETNDYLIINKPAGLIVHGGPGINELTLTDWLLKKYPDLKKVGDDQNRPGLVHRLDKLVSGCMIITLNNKMFQHLKQQFINKDIKKEYQALVTGQMTDAEGVITKPIGRNPHGKFVAHHYPADHDKLATTKWVLKKQFKEATLLTLTPLTGRTHQLRVHCRALGHPIVGDPLYGNKKQMAKLPKLPRIFLHAAKLKFTDLQNNLITINCPLPKELTNYLRQLKPL